MYLDISLLSRGINQSRDTSLLKLTIGLPKIDVFVILCQLSSTKKVLFTIDVVILIGKFSVKTLKIKTS